MNIVECVTRTNSFGVQTVHNVCTGQVTEIPWGAVDWIVVCGLMALGVAFLLQMCLMIYTMWKD